MVTLGPLSDPLDQQRELCRAWFQPGLTDDDRDWLRRQLALINVEPPHTDISWLRMTTVRG